MDLRLLTRRSVGAGSKTCAGTARTATEGGRRLYHTLQRADRIYLARVFARHGQIGKDSAGALAETVLILQDERAAHRKVSEG
jgi:hypothetical protein